MESEFEKLLVALSKADVRYLLVGGLAVALNGFVRLTDDVDILIETAPDNLERLLRVLETFGEGHARELRVEDFSDEEGAIRVVEEFPLDLFTRLGGLRYPDLLRYRADFQTQGTIIPYLNRAGLILLKQGSVREKDQIDVQALQKLSPPPH